MEQFKLDRYLEINNQRLDIYSLDVYLSSFIINSIFSDLKIDRSPEDFFSIINNCVEDTIDVSSINTSGGLTDLFKSVGDVVNLNLDKLFLVWDIQKVDVCSVTVLRTQWDFIWYGSADEALVLYIPNKLIILITDWGEIKIKKLN